MDKTQYEELVDILDNFGSNIEDFMGQIENPGEVQVMIGLLQQKLHDLLFDLQTDIEKMDITEMAL